MKVLADKGSKVAMKKLGKKTVDTTQTKNGRTTTIGENLVT